MRSQEKMMILVLGVLVLLAISLSSCIEPKELGKELFRYIPAEFSCSRAGFDEFSDTVESHVRQEDPSWFGLVPGEDPDSDMLGRIFTYLSDFNSTLESKCQKDFPGLYRKCFYNKNVKPVGEETRSDIDGPEKKVSHILTGPIQTFGIFSARIEVMDFRDNLLYTNYKNILEDSLTGGERNTRPGTDSDFDDMLSCFKQGIKNYDSKWADPNQPWNRGQPNSDPSDGDQPTDNSDSSDVNNDNGDAGSDPSAEPNGLPTASFPTYNIQTSENVGLVHFDVTLSRRAAYDTFVQFRVSYSTWAFDQNAQVWKFVGDLNPDANFSMSSYGVMIRKGQSRGSTAAFIFDDNRKECPPWLAPSTYPDPLKLEQIHLTLFGGQGYVASREEYGSQLFITIDDND